MTALPSLRGRCGDRGKGWFYEPTVLADCRQDMEIVQKEIFGPVVPVASKIWIRLFITPTIPGTACERLAPPITQLLNSRIYQLIGRVSFIAFLRAALPLLHGCCRFLHGTHLALAAHIRSPGNRLACFTQAAS
jgi:Aldehyde dehydrogenase family